VVLVPALALVVGVVLGGVVVGVAPGGVDPQDPSVGEDTGQPTETTSDGPATALIVPDSCLEAAETVQQATGVIRDGLGAIREFRADEIIDLLDQLENLDTQAREQAGTCTGTTVTDAPLEVESPSPSPSTSPSVSPTPAAPSAS
jgi:hypothetical protein